MNITGADATRQHGLEQHHRPDLRRDGRAGQRTRPGVADTAPGTMIGPGNVISANLIGVLISGATATDVTVIGNLIGTDSTGEADLGNAQAGVDIESATGVIVEGNGQGSQVISGNQIGVEINGSASTGNLVEGNFIGIDQAGTADRGNANEGVLIEGVIRQHGGRHDGGGPQRDLGQPVGNPLDGSTATGNLVEGNYIGTDVTGTLPLGNEIDGIIFSDQRVEQHRRRDGRRPGQHDCLQRGGRRPCRVRDGRLDPLEQHLFQRRAGHRAERNGQ